MNKLKFVKPRKANQKVYIRGREVVRWGYYRDSKLDICWEYAITKDRRGCPRDDLATLLANGRVDGEPFAEYRATPRPQDRFVRRARWSTAPWLQRSYTKLAALCRKDFEARSKTQETVQ